MSIETIDTNNAMINTFAERTVKAINALPRIGHPDHLKLGDVIGALRAEAVHERYQAPIRSFYDLSTAHVSQDARRWLETQAWANAAQSINAGDTHPVAAFTHGWVMWVPDAGVDWDGDVLSVHPDLRDACVEARMCGCDYLMFDADAPTIGTLPVYQDDETSMEGFSEEEKEVMALADNGDFAERTREQMKALDDAIVVGVNDAGQVYAEAEDGTETIIGDPLDTPESIIANTSANLADNEKLCPDCGGLGAFPDTGADCPTCDGGGSVAVGLVVAPEDAEANAALSDEDRDAMAVEMADKVQRRPNREKFMVDTEAVHPEDGLPMETDAYGGDIATLLEQEPTLDLRGATLLQGDVHIINGTTVLTIRGIAKLLAANDIDQGLINIITGRLMYAARRGVEMAGKKNAIAELQTACVDILTEIDAEIEQRKTGGNEEDWNKLEEKSNRLSKAVRALV